jgi:hypothetical protein
MADSRKSQRERIDWADMPVVFIVLPSCPVCGSISHETIRSEPNGDGTTTRKAVCRDCDSPFKISVELPEIGNDESPIG